jgi:chromosome segregation ATPase
VNSYLQSKLCENRDRSRIRQSDESKVVQLDKKLDDLQERFDFLSTKVNRVCDDAMAVRTRRQLEERLTSRLDELQSKLQNQADDLSRKLQDLCVRFDTSIPELDSKLLLFEQHAASVEMCNELEMRLTTQIHEFQSESHQADDLSRKLQDLCV